MWLLQKSRAKKSGRSQIAIKAVRDGILELPNNCYRSIIESSSINFELRSEAEQDAILDNFQSFLNSLPCSIQILVRVRELDIDHYLEGVKSSQGNETSKVYQELLANYSDFIKGLVSGNKILSRSFYVVISYDPTERVSDLDIAKEQIHLAQDVVIKGLEKLGMKAKVLSSLEILSLFYTFYNPDTSKIQGLKEQALQAILSLNYV